MNERMLDEQNLSEKYDYGEACPVSMATSILAERWTLQIIREMFLGSTKYSQFQKYMPNISPTLLKNRLRMLEENGIILRKKTATQGRYDYYLTPSGKALGPVLTEIGKWGMRFANEGMTEKQNTVYGLLRDLSGAIDLDELPDCDITIQFTFKDNPDNPRHFINIYNGEAQFCSQDLGYEVDVYITTTVEQMTKIWYGELSMHKAIESEAMLVVGNIELTNNISKWLRVSGFATGNGKFTPPA
ncbi:helix-turn-helix domain-containing protein [Aliikangiella sp. G2MR2-5]|uniref:winged helix-turn-helix transcriptional regulator n=1 Tax=Aliikangiella sp. G2MR2-5 TaxID=2788943 RepID=UPI0018AA3258|nr:helix-turn-helix domain-containing protein [Aliikangiella sp. G2MR2-5]